MTRNQRNTNSEWVRRTRDTKQRHQQPEGSHAAAPRPAAPYTAAAPAASAADREGAGNGIHPQPYSTHHHSRGRGHGRGGGGGDGHPGRGVRGRGQARCRHSMGVQPRNTSGGGEHSQPSSLRGVRLQGGGDGQPRRDGFDQPSSPHHTGGTTTTTTAMPEAITMSEESASPLAERHAQPPSATPLPPWSGNSFIPRSATTPPENRPETVDEARGGGSGSRGGGEGSAALAAAVTRARRAMTAPGPAPPRQPIVIPFHPPIHTSPVTAGGGDGGGGDGLGGAAPYPYTTTPFPPQRPEPLTLTPPPAQGRFQQHTTAAAGAFAAMAGAGGGGNYPNLQFPGGNRSRGPDLNLDDSYSLHIEGQNEQNKDTRRNLFELEGVAAIARCLRYSQGLCLGRVSRTAGVPDGRHQPYARPEAMLFDNSDITVVRACPGLDEHPDHRHPSFYHVIARGFVDMTAVKYYVGGKLRLKKKTTSSNNLKASLSGDKAAHAIGGSSTTPTGLDEDDDDEYEGESDDEYSARLMDYLHDKLNQDDLQLKVGGLSRKVSKMRMMQMLGEVTGVYPLFIQALGQSGLFRIVVNMPCDAHALRQYNHRLMHAPCNRLDLVALGEHKSLRLLEHVTREMATNLKWDYITHPLNVESWSPQGWHKTLYGYLKKEWVQPEDHLCQKNMMNLHPYEMWDPNWCRATPAPMSVLITEKEPDWIVNEFENNMDRGHHHGNYGGGGRHRHGGHHGGSRRGDRGGGMEDGHRQGGGGGDFSLYHSGSGGGGSWSFSGDSFTLSSPAYSSTSFSSIWAPGGRRSAGGGRGGGATTRGAAGGGGQHGKSTSAAANPPRPNPSPVQGASGTFSVSASTMNWPSALHTRLPPALLGAMASRGGGSTAVVPPLSIQVGYRPPGPTSTSTASSTARGGEVGDTKFPFPTGNSTRVAWPDGRPRSLASTTTAPVALPPPAPTLTNPAPEEDSRDSRDRGGSRPQNHNPLAADVASPRTVVAETTDSQDRPKSTEGSSTDAEDLLREIASIALTEDADDTDGYT